MTSRPTPSKMSLSPWDLSGQFGFQFDLYRPRRASYVFATRTNRQRNESYRSATKSSMRHAGESKVDFIEGLVRKKRKDSYKAATQREELSEFRRLHNKTRSNGFNDKRLFDKDKTKLGGARKPFRAIAEAPELTHTNSVPSLRSVQSMNQLSSMEIHRPSFDAMMVKKAASLNSLKANSLDRSMIFNPLKEEEELHVVSESVRRYRRNLIILSIGFLLVFSAFRAIQNLQSSLNGENKLGVVSMSFVHGTMFFTCLLTPSLINRFTTKWTMLLGLLFYIFWIAANVYPSYYTLLPTSIGVGFGQSLAWGAQVSYIQNLAEESSLMSQGVTQQELFKFNGIFLALFQTSHIWGNLLSSLLLRNSVLMDLKSKDNTTVEDIDSQTRYCGVYDDCEPEIPYLWGKNNPTTNNASKQVVKLMCGLLVFAVVGFLIIIFGLERNTTKSENDKQCQNIFWANISMLHSHPKFLFLIPLLVFNGFEQAFIYADYTKSYITCTIGIEFVGYNMITLGVINTICSVLVGIASRHLPREAIIGMGAVLQIGLLVFLLVWIPQEDLKPVFFAVSALWGICDAVWQTQCNFLVSVTCQGEHETAFQNLRMLQGFGAAVAFLLGAFVCASVKLYILIAILTLAILGYVVVEIQLKNAELRSRRNAQASQSQRQDTVSLQSRDNNISRDENYASHGGLSRDSTCEKLNVVSF